LSGGVYCLLIRIPAETEVRVGALGSLRFKPGLYVYVGSALKGFEARVGRHVRTAREKRVNARWHIDYLLSHEGVELQAAYGMETSRRMECEVAGMVSRYGEPVKRFGCSDCRCESHLFRIKEPEKIEKIFNRWIRLF